MKQNTRNFLNQTKKFSDFSTFTRARATFSRICQRLFLATIATFRTFSDFQSQTRAGGRGRNQFSKSRLEKNLKKIAAPDFPGLLFVRRMHRAPGVYVQDVTQAR